MLLGLLAAMVPATWAARATLSSLLASSAVRGGGGHGRMRRGMIVAQVALSLVLLSSGALVVRSFERLLRADPGFRAGGRPQRSACRARPSSSQAHRRVAFQDRVERRSGGDSRRDRCQRHVRAAAHGVGVPDDITVPGAPGNTASPDRDAPLVDVIGTRASYVQVMGMRVVAGRAFDPVRQRRRQEALIDRRLASAVLPEGRPSRSARQDPFERRTAAR